MLLTLPAFENGAPIPEKYAYCIPDVKNHKKMGRNLNPQMVWSDVPEETQSLVILVVDTDVPTLRTEANKEGKTLAKSMPRQDFYHMVLIDIPPALREIQEGQDANGVDPKPPGPTPYGVRGVNDYSHFNGGYDGPCPPWNDELVHHYHFRLYALDLKSLGLIGNFTGQTVLKAMQNHILAYSDWTGTYTLNPKINQSFS